MAETEEDCPEILIKKARTKWQKLVAIEFVHQHNLLMKIKKDLEWQRWLITSVFLTMLGILIRIIFF